MAMLQSELLQSPTLPFYPAGERRCAQLCYRHLPFPTPAAHFLWDGQASESLGYTSMALVKAMKAGELVEVNSDG